MSIPIALIAGLGNPGSQYLRTRHNAGADFVTALAESCDATLKPEAWCHGLSARIQIGAHELRLLIPGTYMNRSGQSVGAAASFYKLDPESILVAHDELDLAPGEVRFKRGGGHGGHNGLRDIIGALGNASEFHRLRIGIGHPGVSDLVSPWVLSRPAPDDRARIDACIREAIRVLPDAVEGKWAIAMNHLHTFSAD